MMPRTVFEELIGPINGVNTTFSTSEPYESGRTRVWRNGVLQMSEPAYVDGWDEVPPTTIVMREAPLTGDALQIHYYPATP